MKYYHLIAVSGGLFLLQFVLQNVFEVSLPYFIRTLFFILQSILFVGYTLLMIFYQFHRRAQAKQKQEPTSQTINRVTR